MDKIVTTYTFNKEDFVLYSNYLELLKSYKELKSKVPKVSDRLKHEAHCKYVPNTRECNCIISEVVEMERKLENYE